MCKLPEATEDLLHLKAENRLKWLELWGRSGGTGVRQAATLVMLGLLNRARKGGLILNVMGRHTKAFFFFLALN